MSIGQKIIELRESKGMSRAELATAMDITYYALSKYETDDRQIDHALLIAFADFFNISIDYLLGRKTEVVAEEGLFYGLDEDERKAIRGQADYYRYRKKLPDDRRDGSSGLTDIDKDGKKPKFKKAK